jgi:large subunit ribosomal protein L25
VAGDRFRLEVRERERLGSPESRRLRKQGFVPGVLYGKTGAKAFVVKERDLRTALTGSSGLHAVLDVVLEGQSTPHSSILKEYQRDPIRGHVRHIDLLEVRLDVAIQATVNVHLHGAEEAPGVKEGGVLSQELIQITVEALPADIPEGLQHDVSELESGATLTVADLTPPRGVTFVDDPEAVVATITAPSAPEADSDELEVETELVDERGAEARAQAEGDTAEEAAQKGAAAELPGGDAE